MTEDDIARIVASTCRETMRDIRPPKSTFDLTKIISVALALVGLSWGVGTYIFKTNTAAAAEHHAHETLPAHPLAHERLQAHDEELGEMDSKLDRLVVDVAEILGWIKGKKNGRAQ